MLTGFAADASRRVGRAGARDGPTATYAALVVTVAGSRDGPDSDGPPPIHSTAMERALDADPAGAAPTAETTWIDGPLTLATPDPIARLTAVELAGLLRRRELSAMEALDATLDPRRAARPGAQPILRAALRPGARRSPQRADEVLARGEGGPLTGLPVTAKDSQWLAGVESAVGSLTMRGFVPGETSVALERFEAPAR